MIKISETDAIFTELRSTKIERWGNNKSIMKDIKGRVDEMKNVEVHYDQLFVGLIVWGSDDFSDNYGSGLMRSIEEG